MIHVPREGPTSDRVPTGSVAATLQCGEIGGNAPPASDNKDLVRFGAESPSRNSENMIG